MTHLVTSTFAIESFHLYLHTENRIPMKNVRAESDNVDSDRSEEGSNLTLTFIPISSSVRFLKSDAFPYYSEQLVPEAKHDI